MCLSLQVTTLSYCHLILCYYPYVVFNVYVLYVVALMNKLKHKTFNIVSNFI